MGGGSTAGWGRPDMLRTIKATRAAAPAPLAVGTTHRTSVGWRTQGFGWVKTQHTTTALKLRHSGPLDAKGRVRFDLVAAFPLHDGHVSVAPPFAALQFQLDPEGSRRLGTLEVTSKRVAYRRDLAIPTGLHDLRIPAACVVGITYDGHPIFTPRLRDWRLALPAALCLLALGRPVTLTHAEVGLLSLDIPLAGDAGHALSASAIGEVTASLRRTPGSVELDVRSVDAVLRLGAADQRERPVAA